jgi:23S rRNA (cytidine1920-2'-O)/16S rRNA (cytidine1409-2'-O)-methyltransferase
VTVAGQTASKAATAVEAGTPLVVTAPVGPSYVSRGGHKLAGALEAFGYDPAGTRALDAGASTGGFTDVPAAPRRGARRGRRRRLRAAVLVAADRRAGHRPGPDQRRTLDLEQVGEPVQLVVADLSFIPLGLVLPALLRCCTPDADLLPMVKPQFEVGRERLPPAGSYGTRRCVRRRCARWPAGRRSSASACRVDASPLPGPSGNVCTSCG